MEKIFEAARFQYLTGLYEKAKNEENLDSFRSCGDDLLRELRKDPTWKDFEACDEKEKKDKEAKRDSINGYNVDFWTHYDAIKFHFDEMCQNEIFGWKDINIDLESLKRSLREVCRCFKDFKEEKKRILKVKREKFKLLMKEISWIFVRCSLEFIFKEILICSVDSSSKCNIS